MNGADDGDIPPKKLSDAPVSDVPIDDNMSHRHIIPKRALLSVYDKRGIVDFARFLVERGVQIISTGGTARALTKANIPLKEVSNYTGFPELMNGRVKTLHPKIHAGILALREEHYQELATYEIATIDLVCVNLYPFEQVAQKGAPISELLENIDIGGPSLIRAAAKNYPHVTVLTDPSDYEEVMHAIEEGGVSPSMREKLAVKAFSRTADYDATIHANLSQKLLGEGVLRLHFSGGRRLRYGENHHQIGDFFIEDTDEPTVASMVQHHGKELSYTNMLDISSALECVKDISIHHDGVVVAIVKHTNPCGLAVDSTVKDALKSAWEGDPLSAFGSIVCTNTTFDASSAEYLMDKFVEVILAPSFTEDALEMLMAKSQNLRLITLDGDWKELRITNTYSYVPGGMLRQTRNTAFSEQWECVTKTPFPEEMNGLASFAYLACKHIKSNAIVLARGEGDTFSMLSMGSGQPNRVDAVQRLAIPKAIEALKREYLQLNEGGDAGYSLDEYIEKELAGCVMASDAFFPFSDSIEVAAHAGIRYIVSPGGSIRDDEVIGAANRHGVAMIFTHMRHFIH